MPPLNPSRHDEAERLYRSGLGLADVGLILHCARTTVSAALRARGIDTSVRRRKTQTLEGLKLRCTVDRNECWVWSGAMSGGKGGGCPFLRTADGLFNVRRLAYEFENGPIDARLMVYRECSNPRCINPDHSRAGTRKDMARSAKERGTVCAGAMARLAIQKRKPCEMRTTVAMWHPSPASPAASKATAKRRTRTTAKAWA